MSAIYSLFRYSVSLITEPFVSLLGVVSSMRTLDDPVLLAKKKNEDNYALQTYKKVEGVALEKINLFLSNLGVQPGTIIIRENIVAELIACGGSLKDGAVAALILNPKVAEEIQTDFTLEHRFWIAHEVEHLFHDDCWTTEFQIIAKTCLYSLIAFTISLYAFGQFTNSDLAKYLLSCTVAKVTRLFTLRTQKHTMEFKADFWAVQRFPEIAQGAITFFKKLDKGWSDLFKKKIEISTERSRNSPFILERGSWIATTYYYKFLLSAHERAITLNMSHPHFKTRIAALSQFLISK